MDFTFHSNITKREVLIGVTGGGLGAALATVIVQHVYQKRINALVAEVDSVSEHYINATEILGGMTRVTENFEDMMSSVPDVTMTNYQEIVQITDEEYYPFGMKSDAEEYEEVIQMADEQMDSEPLVTVNLVDREIPDWDWDQQISYREGNDIYPLHRDEFHSNERGFEQEEIMFFMTDAVLCDQQGHPIENPGAVVGQFTWGFGSGSEDLAYIRNERLNCEYEIVRMEGSYASEYLGIEPEEERRPHGRMRPEDD